jgi:uncharacterized protein
VNPIPDMIFGERIEIPFGDSIIAASVHVPHFAIEEDGAATQKLPCIILCHGFGGNRHEWSGLFIRAAARMVAENYVVIRFDFRSCGESSKNIPVSLESQRDDVLRILEYIGSGEFAHAALVDTRKILLVGFSMGGLATAYAVSDIVSGRNLNPHVMEPLSFALWNTPFDMEAVVTSWFGPLAVRRVRTRGSFNAVTVELTPKFFDSLAEFDPEQEIPAIRLPVLVVHGTQDDIVPKEAAKRWMHALRNAPMAIKMIHGADHAFSDERCAEQAIKSTLSWFQLLVKM